MVLKKWIVKDADTAPVAQLQKDLPGLNPVFHRLLAMRGVRDYETARAFFRPELASLHDPFLMKSMHDAVARIHAALLKKERVLVYGDYDVDGTTAVAVVYSFLRDHFPGETGYYIPHRYREGYGISRQGIDYAAAGGYGLLITLDCGIKSAELIAYAATLGIDVIVCDHHMPDDILPPAYAILNPKQPGCAYPYKELSGCGIGFKLICALAHHWKLDAEAALQYLDLVATSIAADMVPLDGENRILAFYGLKKVNTDPCLAVKVLKETEVLQRDMDISDLVFVIGPRVNAAGRMDDGRKAVDFFIEKDPETSRQLAEVLQSDNSERKEVDKTITREALDLICEDSSLESRKSTVLFQPHWHKGVVGIVASRLIDHYYRPTVILTGDGDFVSGSARSVRGFNIYEAVHDCRDLLQNYGGHFYAAGMTLSRQDVPEFMERFEQAVQKRITDDMLVPELQIDAELELGEITRSFYNILRQFEPFGPDNARPVFLSRNVRDYRDYSRVVKDQHLKLVVTQYGRQDVMDGIGFGLAGRYEDILAGPCDIAYTIEENNYQGKSRIQLKLIDIRRSLPDEL